MAGYNTQMNPWGSLQRQMPRTGPYVQNSGGMAPNTAPPKTFLPTPGLRLGAPGPAQLSQSPNPSGQAGPLRTFQPLPQQVPQKGQTPGLNSTAGLPPGAMNFGPQSFLPGEQAPRSPFPTRPGDPSKTPPPAGIPGAGTQVLNTGTPPPMSTPESQPNVPPPGANGRPGGGGQAGGGQAGGGQGTGQGLPMDVYGRSGGTAEQATPGSIESQIRDYITGAMSGSVTPEFINRAKQDVFRSVQGQTRQGSNQINEDAIRRGLFRSGIPAEGIAGLQGQAQSAMARGVADILNNAENQNIQGRQAAAGVAGNLLGMNRSYDQYTQQRIDAEKARQRAAAAANATFTYIDPDTGQAYELPENMF